MVWPTSGRNGTRFISPEDRYDAALPLLFLGQDYAESGHGLREHYVSLTKPSEISTDDLLQMCPELCRPTEFDKELSLHSVDSKPQQNNDATGAGNPATKIEHANVKETKDDQHPLYIDPGRFTVVNDNDRLKLLRSSSLPHTYVFPNTHQNRK